MDKFHLNTFVLRTPLLRLNKLVTNELDLIKAFKEPILREALYTASKDMYNELLSLERGEHKDKGKKDKILIGLYKYYTRLCTRPTPFGLFAGLNIGDFGAKTDIVLGNRISLNLRLDMDLVCELYYILNKQTSLYKWLTFYPNNSLYKVRGQWRYVEYQFKDNAQRYHNLVSVDDNEALSVIIEASKSGLAYQELLEILLNYDVEEHTAVTYLNELIKSQVLFSNLYPSVSGDEYQTILFEILEGMPEERYNKLSSTIRAILKNDEASIIDKILLIKEEFLSFDETINPKNIIQIDLYKDVDNCTMEEDVVRKASDVLRVVTHLTPQSKKTTALERFKLAFYERYESQFLPLSVVMDTDIGIGYRNAVTAVTPYVNPGLTIPEKEIYSLKLKLYSRAIRENAKSVEITKLDLKEIENDTTISKADSFYVLGNVLIDKKGNKIFRYRSGGGISVLNMLGRFGHLSKEIKDLCAKIADTESDNYPNAVLAEIVHLPQGRIGNVVTRPHYRKYEIPYLSNATVPSQFQIPVEDILVGIVNSKIVLYSKTLEKEVIPRLASAHNFENDSLPIYHFLCDLQRQGIQSGFFWSWDELYQADFLPRVTYEGNILSSARWNFDTKPFQTIDFDTQSEAFYKMVSTMKFPDQVILPEGDNELYINLKTRLGALTFLKNCKKKSKMVVEEFIYEEFEGVDGYSNEIIVPFINRKSNENVLKNFAYVDDENGRILSPLSEWIFFKIYTGKKYMEELLTKTLPTLISTLREQNIISKWFFIRYADPKDHLRLRFHLTKTDNRNLLLLMVNNSLQELISNKLIWDLQICTYKREFERYGAETMKYCESIFFHNSELVINILPSFRLLSSRDQLLFVIYFINRTLSQLNLEFNKKMEFVSYQASAFNKEFNLAKDKLHMRSLNDEYRECRYIIKHIADGSQVDTIIQFEILSSFIDKYFEATQEEMSVIKDFYTTRENRFFSILASLIHMFINRLFYSNQRHKEMKAYYFLDKEFYSSNIKMLAAPQLKTEQSVR
jgi:lantibiotic biosynthesis protein